MERITTGKIGEKIAIRYLRSKGYVILANNYRLPFAEIDIIATKAGILIFVEVKTLTGKRSFPASGSFNPEDNLHTRKQLTLRRAASWYANRVIEEGGSVEEIRIDLIALVLGEGRVVHLRHYENVLAR